MADGLEIGMLVTGALVLAGSIAGARGPVITPLEQRAFRAINGLPDWLLGPLWVPMQLGNLAVGTAVGLAVALLLHDWRLATGVVIASALKLVSERVLRARMAPYLVVRQRPGTSQPGAVLRGSDVPMSGPSFPSGHVILVAAVTAVLAPNIALTTTLLPIVLIALVMTGRVFVGAHNPLDVTAGLGTGLVVGALVAMALY